jgi:hypothetical protein
MDLAQKWISKFYTNLDQVAINDYSVRVYLVVTPTTMRMQMGQNHKVELINLSIPLQPKLINAFLKYSSFPVDTTFNLQNYATKFYVFPKLNNYGLIAIE